jgi:hypothetical protein
MKPTQSRFLSQVRLVWGVAISPPRIEDASSGFDAHGTHLPPCHLTFNHMVDYLPSPRCI